MIASNSMVITFLVFIVTLLAIRIMHTNKTGSSIKYKRIGGVMVSVLASSAVDRGVKPKTIKLAFVASSLRTQH